MEGADGLETVTGLVDALTLMRDQTAQEHERTVDALQALVTSQRETIDGQSATIADLSQRVRWWPSVLRALGLVS